MFVRLADLNIKMKIICFIYLLSSLERYYYGTLCGLKLTI